MQSAHYHHAFVDGTKSPKDTIIDIIRELKIDIESSLFDYENNWETKWELIQNILSAIGFESYCVEPLIKQIYMENPNTSHVQSPDQIKHEQDTLEYLKKLELPEQRTKEWFEFRQTRLTASELSYCVTEKAGSAVWKKLMLQKICPEKVPYISSAATAHGTLFEEVAQYVYERLYGVALHEFGCVPHKDVHWLAASPDGISDDAVMVEIKCPYSRIPKGVPSLTYYTQIQAQLEVCDLQKCDFMECLITPYETRKDYILDTTEKGNPNIRDILQNSIYRNTKREYLPKKGSGVLKGVAVILSTINGPVNKCISWDEMTKISSKDWVQKILDENYSKLNASGYTVKYWVLREVWITRITRNHNWFQQEIVPKAAEFWSQLEEEKGNMTIEIPNDNRMEFVEETL